MRERTTVLAYPSRIALYPLLFLFVALSILLAASQLAASPRMGHGYIGVVMQELTKDVRDGLGLKIKSGVLVSDVMDDSPAEEAGLEDGDVIIEFDGRKVRSPRDLKKLVLRTDVGDEVEVKIVRNNEKKTLHITVGEEPESGSFTLDLPEDLPDFTSGLMTFFNPARRLGVRVTDLNEDLGAYFDVGEGEGVLVLDVEDDSPAADAGIKPGDVIVELNGEKIHSAAQLKDEIRDLEGDENVDLKVIRRGKGKKLSAKLEESEGCWSLRSWKYRRPFGGRVYISDRDRDSLRREIRELKEEVEKLKRKIEKSERS
jgi:serine protease Do